MELLETIVQKSPGTEVILLTGHYSTDSALEAIQKGACDYLTKPISIAGFSPPHQPPGGGRRNDATTQ
jgi:DNA-binding NtrC family response regulator